MKNCERRFHCFVATKDFLQELVKIIGPKYDPPQAVQEKVLQMIQVWRQFLKKMKMYQHHKKITIMLLSLIELHLRTSFWN